MASKLSAILGMVGNTAKEGAKISAAQGGSKLSGIAKAGYAHLKDQAAEKLPRGIFNAMGGNKIPLLENIFGKIDSDRLKARAERKEKEAEKKKEQDQENRESNRDKREDRREEKDDRREEADRIQKKHDEANKDALADQSATQTTVMEKIHGKLQEIRDLLENGVGGGKGKDEEEGGGILGALKGIASAALNGALMFGSPKKMFGAVKNLPRLLMSSGGALLNTVRAGGSAILSRGAGLLSGAKGLMSRVGIGALASGGGAGLGSKLMGLGKTGLQGAAGLLAAGKSAIPRVMMYGTGLLAGGKALGSSLLEKGSGLLASGKNAITGAAGGMMDKLTATESGKAIAKLGPKAVGKSLVKKIPLVGLLAGLGFAGKRAWDGDWKGAGLETLSGLASVVPGAGTAASVGIDVALAKRDYDKMKSDEAAANPKGPLFDQPMDISKPPVPGQLLAGVNPTVPTDSLAPMAVPVSNITGAPATASAIQTAEALQKSSQTPIEILVSTMENMLGLMRDENGGIFVRPAREMRMDPVMMRTMASQVSPAGRASPEQVGWKPREQTFNPNEVPSRQMDGFTRTRPASGPGGQTMGVSIYDAARANGFSDTMARVLVGEVGRENSLREDLIFGQHTDPSNSARNAGMLSFQGERRDALMKHLANIPGALDASGNMTRSQENLNGQLSFIRKEIDSGQFGSELASMIGRDDVDPRQAADVMGRDYIKWRINDPKYRDSGIRNRESFQASLAADLSSRQASQVSPAGRASPVSNLQSDLYAQTQAAIDSGVKYGFGSKSTSSGMIDCSGWVAQMNKSFISSLNDTGTEMAGTNQAMKMFDAPAAGIVENLANVTGKVLRNDELTVDSLREGMIIGEDNGDKGWDAGRYKGIDHVTQVVKDPVTGQMMISQSSSGKGVNLTPADQYLAAKNAKGTQLYGVDTNAALDRVTGGQYTANAANLSQDAPKYADAIQRSSTELEEAKIASNQPTVIPIVSPGGGGGEKYQASQGSGAPTPSMRTRNGDSSIRRITDNFMSGAMPIA